MRISDWSSDVCSSDLMGDPMHDLACLRGHGTHVLDGMAAAKTGKVVHRIADVANLDVEYGSDLRSFAQELTAIACDEAPFGSIRHVAAKPEGKEFDQRVNGIALLAVDSCVHSCRARLPGAVGDCLKIGRASCGERVCQYV